jgi:hypothetical protein
MGTLAAARSCFPMRIGAVAYRGYSIRLVGTDNRWSLTVLPLVPELPVLPVCQFMLTAPHDVEAVGEVKRQIDELLAA